MHVEAERFNKTRLSDDTICHVQSRYQHFERESVRTSCAVELRYRHTEVKSRNELKTRPTKAVKNLDKVTEIISIFCGNVIAATELVFWKF
jgi:hypothetical protein